VRIFVVLLAFVLSGCGISSARWPEAKHQAAPCPVVQCDVFMGKRENCICRRSAL